MNKPIQIHMLGKFEIVVHGEPVLLQLKNAVKTMNLLQYLLLKKGPAASSLFETGGFWYADPDALARSPDIQFHLGLGSGIEAGVEKLKNPGDVDYGQKLKPVDEEARAWKTVWSAGQGVGGIADVPSVAELVARLDAEYRKAREHAAQLRWPR